MQCILYTHHHHPMSPSFCDLFLCLFCIYGSRFHILEKICENMRHLSFWVWLISLNMIIFNSIHFPEKDIILFFFFQLNNALLCIYNTFFIHPSVDRHLGWFHNLAVMNCGLLKYIVTQIIGISIVWRLIFLQIYNQEWYGRIIW
jgi:hypothetical protein